MSASKLMMSIIRGGGAEPATDPFWGDTLLLIRGQGTNGDPVEGASLDLTGLNTLERSGTCVLSNAQSKFGGTSVLIPTPGAIGVSTADEPRFNVSAGQALTFETWAYLTASPNGSGLITERYVGGGDRVGFALFFSEGLSGADIVNGPRPSFGRYSGEGWAAAVSPDPVPINQWVHIRGVSTSSQLYIYVNGVLKGTAAASLLEEVCDELRIGIRWDGASSPSPDTYYNDIRITAAARSTGPSFPLPTSYFPAG